MVWCSRFVTQWSGCELEWPSDHSSSKVVADNQNDWVIHIPKALFAYRTALHESSGYSPFRVNVGRSPILPFDIVVGYTPRPEGSTGEANVPQYVEELSTSLRKIFSDVTFG